MSSREDFKSFIPASKSIPELTFKAILVGIILAIVLGAANAYLGLYVGMTVSAVIPGAVMAFAILKPLKGTILEVNLGMMGAAAGEALAAGVIFTVPALVILNKWGFPGWETIQYVPTTIVALIGGILGVLWMISLRRALIIKTDLPFPEGIAVAAVLTTTMGTKGKTGAIWLLFGAVTAALFKFGQLSLHIFRDVTDGVVHIGRYIIGGVERDGYIYGGIAASPALLGVGWIIGPKISSFVFVGGLLGWVVILPLLVLAGGIPVPSDEFASLGPTLGGFFTVWSEQIRFVGVGAMLTGGLWTIWKLRSNLAGGIKEAVIGIKGGQIAVKKRTDQDLNFKWVFLAIIAMIIPIFFVYHWISNYQFPVLSGFMAIFAVLFAFIASAIAGYMAGLLGSSNNPISGVTVSVLLIVSLMLFVAGIGVEGMVIAILIAAVICCAAAISGDVLQSMTCGHMIGATPKRQQIVEIIGVVAAAPFLALVIQMLDKAFGIGTRQLVAPQAFLMAGITKGILGGEMLWPYVLVGFIVAFILILVNLPVLPVAIGLYLPFYLSVPIFFGGGLRALTNRVIAKKYGTVQEEEISDWELAIKNTGVKPQEKAIRTGLLLTAGLIAGEALLGVTVAALIVLGIKPYIFPVGQEPWIPSLLIFILIATLIVYIPLREILAKKK